MEKRKDLYYPDGRLNLVCICGNNYVPFMIAGNIKDVMREEKGSNYHVKNLAVDTGIEEQKLDRFFAGEFNALDEEELSCVLQYLGLDENKWRVMPLLRKPREGNSDGTRTEIAELLEKEIGKPVTDTELRKYCMRRILKQTREQYKR
jgi:hypothetical protein